METMRTVQGGDANGAPRRQKVQVRAHGPAALQPAHACHNCHNPSLASRGCKKNSLDSLGRTADDHKVAVGERFLENTFLKDGIKSRTLPPMGCKSAKLMPKLRLEPSALVYPGKEIMAQQSHASGAHVYRTSSSSPVQSSEAKTSAKVRFILTSKQEAAASLRKGSGDLVLQTARCGQLKMCKRPGYPCLNMIAKTRRP